MNQTPDHSFPVLDSVLFASSFSAGSLAVFHHALKAALVARSKFTVLHLSPGGAAAWTELPGVRETLERWGLLPAVRCPAVPGWEWKKVTCTGGVIQGILETARKESADLIVLSTDGRNGFLDALRGSHSERVLRSATCPLLTVPEGSLAGVAL